ncbi:MAG: protein translocase subunit SecD [Actinobacteria bacterium]|nr:protein translocase subunit SecD [Actinomycetota bacterium]
MVRRLVLSLVGVIVVVLGLLVGNLVAGNVPSLGLDLQGGASVTLQPEGSYDAKALDVAVSIIRSRVDSIGVAEPEIIRQGDTVVVNLPGVEDQQRALDIIGKQGQVLLRPVLQAGTINPTTETTLPGATTVPGSATSVVDSTLPAPSGPGSARRVTATTVPTTTAPTTTSVSATTDSAAPTLDQILANQDENDPNATVVLLGKNGDVYSAGPAGASGLVFSNDASAEINNGEWSVVVGLLQGSAGEDIWNALAARCFAKDATCPTGQIAIALDGTVISAPVVQQAKFTGGNVQISGSFTEAEARDLAKILEFGAVPVKFNVATVQTVSPTLGKDSLRAAIISGLFGVLLVMLFFFFYYRLLTIVVIGGLAVSGAFLWSIIAYLSKTNGLALTLSGVAGIIVSIGVTVDSYVVFFERLKDELVGGKTMRGAAQRSFASAWRTIVAADTVSFIGAIILWKLTVGSVRGFAFFLGLSTLSDIFVAYLFTRPAMLLLARSKFMAGRNVLGVKVAKEVAA